MMGFCFSKKVISLLGFVLLGFGLSLKSQEKARTIVPFGTDTIQIHRLNDTSLLLQLQELQLLINPSGKLPQSFTGETLDLIFITDESQTSFELRTLQQLNTQNAKIFVPWPLAQKLPLEFTTQLDPLKHLDEKERFGLVVTAHCKEDEMMGYTLKTKNIILFIGANGSKTFLPKEIQKIDLAVVSGNGIDNIKTKSKKATEVTYLFPYDHEENRERFVRIWRNAHPETKILIE
ncbi:MAG: hypothetical protein AAGD88_13135 [Bacteroidota bacterium]